MFPNPSSSYFALEPSRWTTPSLILCGDADYRCPIEQAEQYYVALKRLGKNVQFVRYPEQNHQKLNLGNPNLIIDYWTRTIKFFNEYLN